MSAEEPRATRPNPAGVRLGAHTKRWHAHADLTIDGYTAVAIDDPDVGTDELVFRLDVPNGEIPRLPPPGDHVVGTVKPAQPRRLLATDVEPIVPPLRAIRASDSMPSAKVAERHE